MSEEVAERLRALIEERGPITFAEFMEAALYGPGGFYDRPPVGASRHFVTSPHVHKVFGELLAGGLRSMWLTLGEPDPFAVVEVGAGDGTLAGQLMNALGDLPVEYDAVERSSGARQRLAELPVRVHASIEIAPQRVTGCLLANELVDNLPFHRIRRTRRGTREIRVGTKDGRFVEMETECNDELLDELEDLPEVPRGKEVVVQVAGLHFIDRVARLLHHGYAILIDYAITERSGVHGYRDQQVVADVLERPGSSDITSAVDFAALERRAERWGLESAGAISQQLALDALGFGLWSTAVRTSQTEGLAEGRGREAVEAWSSRREASLLADPAGLGALRWLVLKTPSCAWPDWVLSARSMNELDR